MSGVFWLENVPDVAQGRAVAVGVFDGVHWGHRAIFEKLLEVAAQSGARSTALTFERHPAELLAPNRAPVYINTLEQRVELIRSVGVEEVIITRFDAAFASLSREDFIRSVLQNTLGARQVVVGSNFRFGKNREGDIRFLQERAPELGIAVTTVPAVIIGDAPVSSTRVRVQVGRGDVEYAAKLLGRRFALRGEVVMGRQVGRTIGFPTANIQPPPRQLVPARGVYAVEVAVGKSVYHGVCNIGVRPTFGSGSESVEVHLSGFQGNIYGETLDVVFCRRLRDEMAFETPEHLAKQIKQDLERAIRSC